MKIRIKKANTCFAYPEPPIDIHKTLLCDEFMRYFDELIQQAYWDKSKCKS